MRSPTCISLLLLLTAVVTAFSLPPAVAATSPAQDDCASGGDAALPGAAVAAPFQRCIGATPPSELDTADGRGDSYTFHASAGQAVRVYLEQMPGEPLWGSHASTDYTYAHLALEARNATGGYEFVTYAEETHRGMLAIEYTPDQAETLRVEVLVHDTTTEHQYRLSVSLREHLERGTVLAGTEFDGLGNPPLESPAPDASEALGPGNGDGATGAWVQLAEAATGDQRLEVTTGGSPAVGLHTEVSVRFYDADGGEVPGGCEYPYEYRAGGNAVNCVPGAGAAWAYVAPHTNAHVPYTALYLF